MSVGIPDSFDFTIDGGLDLDLSGIPTEYGVRVRELPRIDISLAPVEVRPLELSLRLKELPSIRVHFPVDYRICLALFGIEIAGLRLCGQAQAITEPYVPNPCEARATHQKYPNESAVVRAEVPG